jgi:hypothetical protein
MKLIVPGIFQTYGGMPERGFPDRALNLPSSLIALFVKKTS